MTESQQASRDAHQKGFQAGLIEQRLTNTEEHLSKINGSIERFTEEIKRQSSILQSLRDQFIADKATVIATARALKDQSDKTWSIPSRIALIFGCMASALLIYDRFL